MSKIIGKTYAYADRSGRASTVNAIVELRGPELDGRPILKESVKNENVFQILAWCDQAMKDHGMEKDERKAVIAELSNMSDNEMFHSRLRYHFTVLADQYPHIDALAAQKRDPYIIDCDNCNDEGLMPDYNPGGAGDNGPWVLCDCH